MRPKSTSFVFSLIIAACALKSALSTPCEIQADDHPCSYDLKNLCGLDLPDAYDTIFAARMCLHENVAVVSKECRYFVEKSNPSIVESCFADIKEFCATIRPGENRIHDCLRSHELDITVRCSNALSDPRTSIVSDVRDDDFQVIALPLSSTSTLSYSPFPSEMLTMLTLLFSQPMIFFTIETPSSYQDMSGQQSSELGLSTAAVSSNSHFVRKSAHEDAETSVLRRRPYDSSLPSKSMYEEKNLQNLRRGNEVMMIADGEDDLAEDGAYSYYNFDYGYGYDENYDYSYYYTGDYYGYDYSYYNGYEYGYQYGYETPEEETAARITDFVPIDSSRSHLDISKRPLSSSSAIPVASRPSALSSKYGESPVPVLQTFSRPKDEKAWLEPRQEKESAIDNNIFGATGKSSSKSYGLQGKQIINSSPSSSSSSSFAPSLISLKQSVLKNIQSTIAALSQFS